MKTLYINSRNNNGFTLIELSIVLVIIGLLVGGVLVGQDMIRNSEVTSVMSDIQKYTATIGTFKEKYQVLPGDMPNATSYWGANNNTGFGCTSMYTATTSATSTCNGDGNGRIDATPLSHFPAESITLWKHLQNAGMLEGKFSGQDNGGQPYIAGVSVPGTKLIGGGLTLMDQSMTFCNGGSAYEYACTTPKASVFHFGAISNIYVKGAIISASEALTIDSKYDDGKPGLGTIKAPIKNNTIGWAPDCSTNTDANLAAYDTSRNGPICSLIIEVIL
jgi:prepilin-type N-terminal cleavage/methylation domain-containing protein